MSEPRLNFFAKFWLPTAEMPSVEDQYQDLWRFATVLESIGVPLDVWHPPADTPANSLLNQSFDEAGVTPAALAMARADKSEPSNIRFIAAWNGVEDEGGMGFVSEVSQGPFPCTVDLSSEVPLVNTYDNARLIAKAIIDIWSPVSLTVGYSEYEDKKVFKDRPPVGWMIYLPSTIDATHVPEAAALIPMRGPDGKRRGTLLVSVEESFDAHSAEHVKRANDIEIRLVDQGLLPRYGEGVRRGGG
jgi:hypothetical protein